MVGRCAVTRGAFVGRGAGGVLTHSPLKTVQLVVHSINQEYTRRLHTSFLPSSRRRPGGAGGRRRPVDVPGEEVFSRIE